MLGVGCQAAKKEHELAVKIFCKIKYKQGWAYKKYRSKEGMRTKENYPAAEKSW